MTDMGRRESAIDQFVQSTLEEHWRLEEMACEKAIQSGKYGVARVRDGFNITLHVTGLVPYGELYDFPSPASFEAWRKSPA